MKFLTFDWKSTKCYLKGKKVDFLMWNTKSENLKRKFKYNAKKIKVTKHEKYKATKKSLKLTVTNCWWKQVMVQHNNRMPKQAKENTMANDQKKTTQIVQTPTNISVGLCMILFLYILSSLFS